MADEKWSQFTAAAAFDGTETTAYVQGGDNVRATLEDERDYMTVAPTFESTGLTGAVEGARFVGCTTSGAPASGTFAVADYIVDQAGQMWVCTVAGSPGTWVNPGSGQRLAVAEVTTSPSTFTAVGSASRVDLDAGLTITITVGTRPILLEAWFGQVANNTADNGVGLMIVEGTIGGGTGTGIATGVMTSPVGNGQNVITLRRSLSPSAGSHTYKIMAWVITGGVGTVSAATNLRPFIMATEQ